jgi:hypothetical protein
MSIAAFQHVLPWTEEEYLQLGQNPAKHADGRAGQPLVLAVPVVAVLDTEALLRRPGGPNLGSRRG